MTIGEDDIFVGRIRDDLTVEHGLNVIAVYDNLRTVALNAVKVCETLVEHNLLHVG